MGYLSCMSTSELGKKGEDAALRYLQGLGMELLARNWRSGHYEIDLIMDDGRCLRIVEVKSLACSDCFDPTENITPAKCRKLVKAAKMFISENPCSREVVFDVVAVIFDGLYASITYIPSAYLPIYL